MKKIVIIASSLMLMASCMGDREYQLRKADIAAKANHPATYQPLVVTGPLELKEGASIVSTTPSQPYSNTPIPDGASIQAGLVKDIVNTAGFVGLGALGIMNAGDSVKTVNNNAPASAQGGN